MQNNHQWLKYRMLHLVHWATVKQVAHISLIKVSYSKLTYVGKRINLKCNSFRLLISFSNVNNLGFFVGQILLKYETHFINLW